MAKLEDLILPSKKGYTVKKVRENMSRRNFESGFPDGVYGWPSEPGEPRIRVKALFQYCKEKGITPHELGRRARNHDGWFYQGELHECIFETGADNYEMRQKQLL